jgi:SAM-dependent methyltransferase
MIYNMGVDHKTVQSLLTLNQVFYQTFAANFSATRMRVQPGVRRILASISPQARILDLGCGNGEAAFSLASQDHRGAYLGLDFSAELLTIARQRLADHPHFSFMQADLGTPDWDALDGTPFGGDSAAWQFDLILAFAVLHHLPGRDLHRQTCLKANRLLSPGGCFIHSNWQFLNSDRLRQRIQSWEVAGLDPACMDPGDYLLDWRQGGRGLRYVHHFNPAELTSLAQMTGFKVVESFSSDGEGGNLGLYQVWQKEAGKA